MTTPAPTALKRTRPPEPRGRLLAQARRFMAEPQAGWTLVVLPITAILALPVVAVLYLAATPAENAWPHLSATVLPEALANTLWLALGTATITFTVGTATAWLVTMYRFPGRALVDRLLVIPMAMPTFIVAYCYAELLDYAGPVQTALRSAMGWTSARDYWFPAIRSPIGAMLILSSVLYPYVYLAARASFVQQSICALEVARTLGRTPMATFFAVALPLARPAIAAGVMLVVMETLNDLGAVQHLGVQTLSASIYATWLQRGNLGGAAQLASVLLVVVAMLFWLETIARGGGRVHHTTGRYRAIPFEDIEGARGYLAALVCMLPFVVGFAIPAAILLRYALVNAGDAIAGGFWSAAGNSLMLATCAAIITALIGLVISYARRIARNPMTAIAARLSGFGYALPGTVLALGVLVPLAGIDNVIDAAAREYLGVSTGLLLSGSVIALTFAYVVRFLAVAMGGIDAGLEHISPNLDAAARALGETSWSALRRVHFPMILPALGAAALLVFVDTMKELPATLLLRPFDFETLATHVYSFAALEQVEGGALGALAIVAVGLLPVIALHQTIAGGRAGSGQRRRLASRNQDLGGASSSN